MSGEIGHSGRIGRIGFCRVLPKCGARIGMRLKGPKGPVQGDLVIADGLDGWDCVWGRLPPLVNACCSPCVLPIPCDFRIIINDFSLFIRVF